MNTKTNWAHGMQLEAELAIEAGIHCLASLQQINNILAMGSWH
jgi:hypothetical protein